MKDRSLATATTTAATAATAALAHLRKYGVAVRAQAVAILEQAHARLTPRLRTRAKLLDVFAARLGQRRLHLGAPGGTGGVIGAGARRRGDLGRLVGNLDIGAVAQTVGAVDHHGVARLHARQDLDVVAILHPGLDVALGDGLDRRHHEDIAAICAALDRVHRYHSLIVQGV